MYSSHFGLQHEPFSIAPDPRYLYLSERHREALAHLLYGVRGGGGFVLLTGEIGAGKTTVSRCFLEQVPDNCDVAYVFNPKLGATELLEAICDELGVERGPAAAGSATVQPSIQALNRHLLAAHAAGRNNVLLIDEAQNLSAEVLEQLRLLTNLETAERKLLQVILIGQPELRSVLARPDLEQVAQRVIARYHLGPLDEWETGQYILHRLRVAGLVGASPFDDGAVRRVHRLSRGVPRRINLLCDRALLGAYAHGLAAVDEDVVERAAREVFDDAGSRPVSGEPRSLVRQLAWGAGMLALAVLAGFGTHAWQAGLIGSPMAADAATAAMAQPLPGRAQAPVAAPLARVPMDAALAGAWRDEAGAWRALAGAWTSALGPGDPCDAARQERLACQRLRISLSEIRQLDRPGLLPLLHADGSRRTVVLLGLDDTSAALRTAQGPMRVALGELAPRWRGEFATLWRLPPSASGPRGVDPQWLSMQLGALQGAGADAPSEPASDAASDAAPDTSPDVDLRRRIHAFQVTQGLMPDGVAGPVTLMKLNRALGVDEPRLEPPR